jgi:hypothetical protein
MGVLPGLTLAALRVRNGGSGGDGDGEVAS